MPWTEVSSAVKEDFAGAAANMNTGNWAAWVTGNPLRRDGAGLLETGGSDPYGGSRRTDSHTANVRTRLTMAHASSAMGASNYWGFAFGFTSENADVGDGYVVGHAGGNATLYERLNGGDAQLGSQWSYSWSSGDRIGVQRDGTGIEVYYGASGSMTLRISATDGTYTTGVVAIDIYDPGADEISFDDLYFEEITGGGGGSPTLATRKTLMGVGR